MIARRRLALWGLILGLIWAGALPARAARAVNLGAKEMYLLRQVQDVDRKLIAAEVALEQGDNQVRKVAAALADAESAKANASMHHATAERALARRLSALMRLDHGARVVALGGSSDLSAWTDAERLLQAVARHDRQLWAAMRASQATLDATIALTQEQAQALAASQDRRRQLRDGLAQRRRRKDQMLQAHRRSQDAAVYAQQMGMAKERLGNMVAQNKSSPQQASNQRAPLNRRRGALPWPAPGRVRVAFGQRTEGTFGTTTSHNGWDIAAAAGTPVAAVADGQVAYADWLHGYGQVAIVAHPGGFHTIHAHLARLGVQPGERIRAGQQLGTVGDTGSLRGTVLYFEIRHLGMPQDPRAWLARR